MAKKTAQNQKSKTPSRNRKRLDVFLSYSWANQRERSTLIKAFERMRTVGFLVDTTIPEGAQLHERISYMLDNCHCMIVLLTETSIESHEVREELVRAHERSIQIIPIVEQKVADKLPHFLIDALQIRYSNNDASSFADALKTLANRFSDLRQDFSILEAQRSVRSLGSEARAIAEAIRNEPASLGRFKVDMTNDLLASSLAEIRDLSQGTYNFDLGVERNFLLRARPLFEWATEVYAVSIDSISTFWTNSETNLRELAVRYVKKQPGSAIRLFVFTNADSAHSYRRILEAHFQSYGQKGAVLFCSLETYLDLFSFPNAGHVPEKDFGYLVFPSQGDDIVLEATLGEQHLAFACPEHGADNAQFSRCRELLSELRDKLQPGEFHSKYKVARWDSRLLEQRDNWAKLLKNVFRERSGDVYHFVLFSNKVSADQREIILRTKNKLISLQQEHGWKLGLKDIWFGTRQRHSWEDFKFGHMLDSGPIDDYPFVFAFRFSSRDGLSDYYRHERHSALKYELYKGLSPSMAKLVELIESEFPTKSSSDDFKKWTDLLEEFAQNYIVRMDYLDDEDIDSIVEMPTIAFP